MSVAAGHASSAQISVAGALHSAIRSATKHFAHLGADDTACGCSLLHSLGQHLHRHCTGIACAVLQHGPVQEREDEAHLKQPAASQKECLLETSLSQTRSGTLVEFRAVSNALDLLMCSFG